jgi:hypothetical protein
MQNEANVKLGDVPQSHEDHEGTKGKTMQRNAALCGAMQRITALCSAFQGGMQNEPNCQSGRLPSLRIPTA